MESVKSSGPDIDHQDDPQTTASSNPVRDIVKRLFPEIFVSEPGSIETMSANPPDPIVDIDNSAVVALLDRLWEESVHRPNFSKSVSRIAIP